MTIDEAYEAACKRLRYNIKETDKALKKATPEQRNMILGTGGLALIYANEIHGIALEEGFNSLTTGDHPAVNIKVSLNKYLDKALAEFNKIKKHLLNSGESS